MMNEIEEMNEQKNNAWFEKNKFCTRIDLPFRDCDAQQHPKVSTWLGWLAEIAGYDYSARGLPRDKLISKGQVFLLSRIQYKIEQTPVTYDRLTVRTWERGTEAIWFLRDFEFLDSSGHLLASASTVWLLCDVTSHRILRPSALEHQVGHSDERLPCATATQLNTPENMPSLGERIVVYSDLDANGHLYSAKYGDIFMDFLPESLQTANYDTFLINYVKEGKPGEKLHLYGLAQGNEFITKALHEDDSVCFTAQMKFAKEPLIK